MCKNSKKLPIRRCIACSEMFNKNEMLRVVRETQIEDGKSSYRFKIDQSMKENGRGAYMCLNHKCLTKAIKSRGLERSYKMNVPQEIYKQMEEEMTKVEA